MSESAIIEKVMTKYGNHVKVLSTLAIVITSIVGIAGGYVWLKSVLRPKVEIISVDFPNAVCNLKINGVERVLYGNATLSAGAAWGIRFGTTQVMDIDMYNTIELVKEDRVYEIYRIYEIDKQTAVTA